MLMDYRRVISSLLGLLLTAIPSLALAQEDSLSFGVPEFAPTIQFLDEANTPAAFLLREATSRGLTTIIADTKGAGFALGLTDAMKNKADFLTWSFRLSPNARFSNGEKVLLDDVAFSIDRCRHIGTLAQITSTQLRTVGPSANERENWIDFILSDKAPFDDRARKFPIDLAACPIIEKRSAEKFGTLFGQGTNLVTAGPYQIYDFQTGKQVLLRRFEGSLPSAKGPKNLEIRGFDDPSHGLTALRTGTIDVLFTSEPTVLTKAQADETLIVAACKNYTVVHRKTLDFTCWPELRVEAVRYTN